MDYDIYVDQPYFDLAASVRVMEAYNFSIATVLLHDVSVCCWHK